MARKTVLEEHVCVTLIKDVDKRAYVLLPPQEIIGFVAKDIHVLLSIPLMTKARKIRPRQLHRSAISRKEGGKNGPSGRQQHL